jgi:ankyrin repeat protein
MGNQVGCGCRDCGTEINLGASSSSSAADDVVLPQFFNPPARPVLPPKETPTLSRIKNSIGKVRSKAEEEVRVKIRGHVETASKDMHATSVGLTKLIQHELENANFVDAIILPDDDPVMAYAMHHIAELKAAERHSRKAESPQISTNSRGSQPPRQRTVEPAVDSFLKKNGFSSITAIDGAGLSPLHRAAWDGLPDMVGPLVRAGASVNESGIGMGASPLIIAAQLGRDKVCEILLKDGADVNKQMCSGFGGLEDSPLHVAVLNGHKSICELLLSKKADFNQARVDGASPLHIAVENGRREACALLISSGADINKARRYDGPHGLTPLCRAITGCAEKRWGSDAYFDYFEVCKMLLQGGADVNTACDAGHRPLVLAAEEGQHGVCRLLLHRRADFHLTGRAKTDEFLTPMLAAELNGHHNVCELLRHCGAPKPVRSS